MKTTRFITITALYTALLIGVQFVLSGVAGVELVTPFLLAFSFIIGMKAGVTVAICFSLLRCLIFGFHPTAIILYLIYYSLFALFFGFIGRLFNRTASLKAFVTVTILSVVFTALFTLLDDIITPVFYGFSLDSAKVYFYASLPVMATQCVCSLVTVGILFKPICNTLVFINR